MSFEWSPLAWLRRRPFCTSHDEKRISGLREMAMIDIEFAQQQAALTNLVNAKSRVLRP